jgi:hypothetical protein
MNDVREYTEDIEKSVHNRRNTENTDETVDKTEA